MGFFSDIMGAVSSWITAKGNVAELQYKHKLAVHMVIPIALVICKHKIY